MSSVINVNGKNIQIPDHVNNLSIKDGQVFINGKLYEGSDELRDEQQVTIIVQGDVLGDITTKGPVQVTGTVQGKIRTMGRVDCKEVVNNVETQGHVNVHGNVSGNIQTQGKVEVGGEVQGSIHTMGKVIYGGNKVIGKSRY